MTLNETLNGIPVWMLIVLAILLWAAVVFLAGIQSRKIFPYLASNRRARRARKLMKKGARL